MSKKKDAFDARPKDDPFPRIPTGEYEAQCVKVETSIYRGRQKKRFLHFKIIEGPYQGTILFGVYNYYARVPSASTYYTDWCIASGRLPTRGDRMSPQVFKNKIFLVKVRDAKPKYGDGTCKPEILWYSVVDRIISVSAG